MFLKYFKRQPINNKFKSTKEIGDYGEKLALKFLKKQGYEILCTNYRIRYGEIDIVAKDGLFTVFIEVKYRSKKLYGYPCEAVDKHKQQKIKAVASQYLLRNENNNLLIRFDVVQIINGKIELIKSAF